jgi:hypothetical protein
MDAFATSPFALLDAHGSLRLVTNAVHEDDALCLALVCRAIAGRSRDALPGLPARGWPGGGQARGDGYRRRGAEPQV